MPSLTPAQTSLLHLPLASKTFLEGPSGTGKTTVGVERMLALLDSGVPGSDILVLLPQRTLAPPYEAALRNPDLAAGGVVTISTVSGLAQRMVELFWPLVAEEAGFAAPHHPPTFLNIETAQYHMARIVRPLIEEEGYFESVTLDRNRVYSQILDNLGKAAVVGFPTTEIGARLAGAWIGEGEQVRVYADAQESANAFRVYCLAHNLLDFSLWLETFWNTVWPNPLCRDHLTTQYRHIIYDNIEEDHPASHDLIRDWLPTCQSALLIYDTDAGYRQFLGADPISAYSLKDFCDHHITLDDSFVIPPEMESFRQKLTNAQSLTLNAQLTIDRSQFTIDNSQFPIHYSSHRFYPQLLDWVAAEIQRLVGEGIPPGQIVVLAPYLSDALRFSLMNRLETAGIPVQSHRPSRSLREEPAALCLLTLAALAHPQWNLQPAPFDVAYALRQSLDDLDLIRAQLLAEVLYRPQTNRALLPFDTLTPDMQQRITYVMGERYERLRSWIEKYAVNPPDTLDYFFNRLFGERLSQPGYRFHRDLDSGKVVANLIDSVRNFRWVVGEQIESEGGSAGQEYMRMVQEGIIASQYIGSWQAQTEDAVLLAPAYTFLMGNRPVDVQFWLNVSSSGWYERLYQPLTHPIVLSRHWEPGRIWTDKDEVETSQDTLNRLLTGLLRRCRQKVYLGLSDLDEHGFDQKGSLLKAINRALRA